MRVFAPLVLLLGCVLQAKCQLSAPTIKDYEGEYVYVDDGYADDDYQDLSKFLDEEMEKTGTSSRSTTISIIYSVIVLSGFLLNILGLVMSQRCTAIQYSQKLFMQNLCISCLLLLISLVFSAHYRAYNDWILGGIMCKVLNCLKSLSMFCQCFFTVAVTADYVVMRKRPRIGSIRRTVMEILTVAVGWILALGFSIPMLIFAKTDRLGSERQMCTLFPGYDTRFQPLDSQFDDESTGEWFSGNGLQTDDFLQPKCKDFNNEPYRIWIISGFAVVYACPLMVSTCLCIIYKVAVAQLNTQQRIDRHTRDIPNRHVSRHKQPVGRFVVGGVWVSLIELAYFLCWLPLHVYHIGRIWGLNIGPTECLNLRDFSFVLGYTSCLFLPAIVIAYSRPGTLRERTEASTSSTSSFGSSSSKSGSKGDATPEQTNMHLLSHDPEEKSLQICTAT